MHRRAVAFDAGLLTAAGISLLRSVHLAAFPGGFAEPFDFGICRVLMGCDPAAKSLGASSRA